jgi:hypothetical protein
MGLGLNLRAKLGGLPHPQKTEPLVEISRIASDHAEALGLRVFFEAQIHENKLSLLLHPAAEPVDFVLLEGGSLECAAKTSTLGPGYHKYVVQILDAAGKRLGVIWLGGDDIEGDATGYFSHRDFVRLQDEMATFLSNLLRIVRKKRMGGLAGIRINMPLEYSVDFGDAVATPIGLFSETRLAQAAKTGSEIEYLSQQFFPWWDEGLTARVWRNFGLVGLWMDVPWRRPAVEQERRVCERAIKCFENARTLDARIALPEAEITALKLLLAEEPGLSAEPAECGIGYHRRLWHRHLNDWTIDIPGYFFRRTEDDNATEVFWYGTKEVWCTTYTLEPAKPVKLSELGEYLKADSYTIERDDVVGCANIMKKMDERDTEWSTMSCVFKAAGSFAVITIIFAGNEALDWAIRTFKSMHFAPNREA